MKVDIDFYTEIYPVPSVTARMEDEGEFDIPDDMFLKYTNAKTAFRMICREIRGYVSEHYPDADL